jgi:cellulose synthase/poly-beta-1,6-N-acetylglucosamine synthase-like glycosyltransferase
MDSSEDSIIPFLFYKNGYKIAYAENALVEVLNPSNFKDWLKQRKRNIKGHSTIKKNIKKLSEKNPERTKTFFNEIKRGMLLSFKYVRSFKELIWMKQFYFARLYAWVLAYYEIKYKKKKYTDGWRVEKIDSTKPLDN